MTAVAHYPPTFLSSMSIATRHLKMQRQGAGLPVTMTSTHWTIDGWVIGYRIGDGEERRFLVSAHDRAPREIQPDLSIGPACQTSFDLRQRRVASDDSAPARGSSCISTSPERPHQPAKTTHSRSTGVPSAFSGDSQERRAPCRT